MKVGDRVELHGTCGARATVIRETAPYGWQVLIDRARDDDGLCEITIGEDWCRALSAVDRLAELGRTVV